MFDWDRLESNEFAPCEPEYKMTGFIDWIWDIAFMDGPANLLPSLLIGTAHNTVIQWNPNTNNADHFFYGRDRCILYSMSILPLNGDFLIASGTVFTEVHVWRLSSPEHTLVCRQHAGVIFKLRWNADGRYLLSVSDDRSLIVWRHSASTQPWNSIEPISLDALLQGSFSPFLRLYGHRARLWDCLFVSTFLLSTSEDCSVRLWNEQGVCVAVLEGHKGKHVWCAAFDAQSGIAVTGGNDGAVKIWDIPTITSTAESSVRSFVIPSMAKEDAEFDRKAVRTSKSECIRALCISEDGKQIIIASNWGYIWSLDPNSGLFSTLFSPREHGFVSTLALSQDGTVAASGDYSGELRIVAVDQRFPAITEKIGTIRIGRISFHEFDETHWLLCVVAANGHITLLLLEKTQGTLSHWAECDFETKGAITSILWVPEHRVLCAGDSVGGVQLMKMVGSHEARTLRKCHACAPVCALVLHENNTLWTGGHDGKLVPLLIDWDSFSITRDTAIPIPHIKQIVSIWWSERHELCVSGFHEATYLVWDVSNACEVLSVPAGGWKRPFASHSAASHPSHGFLFAFAAANGFSRVSVFQRSQPHSARLIPAVSAPSHGREVNVVHWIGPIEGEEGVGLLASGGEDRKVQVMRVTRGRFGLECRVLHAFETHSSSVRGLWSFA